MTGISKRAETRLFGIIGKNLSHTLSPRIHNHLFRQLGLNYSYQVFEVSAERLKPAIEGIRALGIDGVNVTFPHKEEVAGHLDRLGIHARKTGAVNTIKNRGGTLVGYNTDVYGLRATLERKMKMRLRGKAVLLLGAGGAARASLWVLIQMKPRKIVVLNRTPERARTMVAGVAGMGRAAGVTVGSLTDLGGSRRGYLGSPAPGCRATGPKDPDTKVPVAPAPVAGERIDLLINATSAGPTFVRRVIATLSGRGLLKHAKVLDLNYGERGLSGKPPADGIEYVDGLYMLCAQAAESFRIWTGIRPDPGKVMRFMTRNPEKR